MPQPISSSTHLKREPRKMKSDAPHSNKRSRPDSCDDEHPEPSTRHGDALLDTWLTPRNNRKKLRQEAQLAVIASHTGFEAHTQAMMEQSEKLKRESGKRSTLKFDARAQAEKKRVYKAENTVKANRNKLEALDLARAEYEEIQKRLKKRAAERGKEAGKKTAEEDTRRGFGSPPLRHIQNEPGNIQSGDNKANPIIIWDSVAEGLGVGNAKDVINVIEKIGDVVNAPLPLTAKQELEGLVNQVDAKLIYSRFEDKDATGDGDSDVHMQVILLWRGRQKIVEHAWEISEEAAGLMAASKLLKDQCFFRELARMRLFMIKRVQVGGKAPMAKNSVAHLKQLCLPLIPSPLEVDKKVWGVADPAARLMKGDKSSNMEDIVMETEILNHEDPSFKAERTPIIVKSHTLEVKERIFRIDPVFTSKSWRRLGQQFRGAST